MTAVDKQISDYIFYHPDIVAEILRLNGYSLKTPLTLGIITESTFKAIYADRNESLISQLDQSMAQEGYSNFEPISMGVSAALSIASSILGANQAKKQRNLIQKIELAKLSNAQMLGELQIRTEAETERTKILLQTLQQYQSDLQTQSSQRIKDVWIYSVGLGAAIGIVYGVVVLLTSSSGSKSKSNSTGNSVMKIAA